MLTIASSLMQKYITEYYLTGEGGGGGSITRIFPASSCRSWLLWFIRQLKSKVYLCQVFKWHADCTILAGGNGGNKTAAGCSLHVSEEVLVCACSTKWGSACLRVLYQMRKCSFARALPNVEVLVCACSTKWGSARLLYQMRKCSFALPNEEVIVCSTKWGSARLLYQMRKCSFALPNEEVLVCSTKWGSARLLYQMRKCSFALPNEEVLVCSTKWGSARLLYQMRKCSFARALPNEEVLVCACSTKSGSARLRVLYQMLRDFASGGTGQQYILDFKKAMGGVRYKVVKKTKILK